MPIWEQTFLGVQGSVFGVLLPCTGILSVIALVVTRLSPLLSGQRNPRTDNIPARLGRLFRLGLFQTRQFRYFWHGVAHSFIFYGFLFSFPHLVIMILLGVPGMEEPHSPAWNLYLQLCDVAATAILAGCILAFLCRAWLSPHRFPANRKWSAYGILAFVFCLTASEVCFRAALAALNPETRALPFAASALAPHLFAAGVSDTWAFAFWLTHEILFFGFLCIVPCSKQFHEMLGLFSVWGSRIETGTVKPCRYGISEENMDTLPYLGAASMKDFTKKQLLGFYACADCGRCSDNCPATLSGRSLSPREFTHRGRKALENKADTLPWSESEIWDCVLCGACERECPLGVEYIDAMVDLRRYAVERGIVPQGMGTVLECMQRTGRPLKRPGGKLWTPETGANEGAGQKIAYLPGSFTISDPATHDISSAVMALLTVAGFRPVLLPEPWRDAGNEARRWGDEYLFRQLRDAVVKMVEESGLTAIVTEDPHTFNTLRNDYRLPVAVTHVSELLADAFSSRHFGPLKAGISGTCAFHDPCYLGRHNGVYEAPRRIMDVMGLKRIELPRSKDKAFCCGSPSAFFYEPASKKRPAGLRLQEAIDSGVDVLITACPWCYANFTAESQSMDTTISVRDLSSMLLHFLRGTPAAENADQQHAETLPEPRLPAACAFENG